MNSAISLVEVGRDGQNYTRSVCNHPVVTQLIKYYENLYSIEKKEQVTAQRGKLRSTENIANAGGNPTDITLVDRLCINPEESVSILRR